MAFVAPNELVWSINDDREKSAARSLLQRAVRRLLKVDLSCGGQAAARCLIGLRPLMVAEDSESSRKKNDAALMQPPAASECSGREYKAAIAAQEIEETQRCESTAAFIPKQKPKFVSRHFDTAVQCDGELPFKYPSQTVLPQRGIMRRQLPCGHVHLTFTVCLQSSAGSVFKTMLMLLQQRPHWKVVEVDMATQRGSLSTPCCNRLTGVNLLLGDKMTTEALIGEARIAFMRSQRSVTGILPQCRHKRYRNQPTTSKPGRTVVNYFDGTRDITLKASMVRTLRRSSTWSELCKMVPESFAISPRGSADERDKLWRAMQRNRFGGPSTHAAHQKHLDSLWIAKSSHGSHGAGIEMFPGTAEGFTALLDHIDSMKTQHPWVVQKYISRPLLYHGRKFDLRVWVLLVSPFVVYINRNGVMRMSSEDYVTSTSILAHLTNHSLQEKGANYSTFEPGNELWFDSLDELLRASSGGRVTFEGHIFPQIKRLVVASMLAVRATLTDEEHSIPCGVSHFQFFGFDMLIDESYQLWLLEINGAPAIAEALRVKMVEGIVKIVIDPVFEPQRQTLDPGESGFELAYPQSTIINSS